METLSKNIHLWLGKMYERESRLKGGCRQECLPHEPASTCFSPALVADPGHGNRRREE